MRLIHFVEQGRVVGGAERYLFDLLSQSDGGLEHAVVLDRGSECEFAGPWPVEAVPWSASAGGAARGADHAGLLERHAGIPLFHSPPGDEVLARCAQLRPEFAVFCHDHRWWCASGQRYFARLGHPCGIRATEMRCALRYHALGCGGLRPGEAINGIRRAAAGRRALGAASAVLVASTFMRSEAARHGARAERTHVVPYPTRLAAGAAANAPPDQTPVVVFASRLTPVKGARLLLDAFSLMRRTARLDIAGAGIEAKAIAKAVAAHPLRERIELLGHVGDAGVRDLLARASAVVVPSLWPEPFGLVGIEALALGKPVVATAVGGIPEWARPERGVLTVPPGSPPLLAGAMDRVLAEGEWSERARHDGRAAVLEHHSVSAHVAALQRSLAPLAGAASPA